MTISAVNSNSDPNNINNQDAFRARMEQTMAPVAQLFGETPDQLMSELQSGNSSLADLAQAKGISQDDLDAAIKQGLQSSPAAAALSDSQLTNIASRIANHHHHGHHHMRQSQPTSSSSAQLGITPLG